MQTQNQFSPVLVRPALALSVDCQRIGAGFSNPMNTNKPFPYTLDPEQIPTRKVVDVTPEWNCAVHVNYACPSACWAEHLEAWRKERRNGNLTAPDPMPFFHVVFDNPHSYGCVAYGDTSVESRRAAMESHVRGMLSGWDRDLTPEQLTRIVNATVQAKLDGVDTGGAPFLACLSATL